MRKLYLFRHARPDFPLDTKLCLGSTDIPLGAFGRIQACLLSHTVANIEFEKVFCSRLSRSKQTAEFLSASPTVLDGLQEMHSGDWDGLDFKEIKQRWPEIYEARGRDFSTPIPGAESNIDGQKRFIAALRQALEMTDGDIAVVAHATCNQSLICHVKGLSAYEGHNFSLDYASLCTFGYDGDFHLESVSSPACPRLDRELCRKLLHAAGLTERIILHSEAVTDMALEIADVLSSVRFCTDRELIICSAMLHDIARLEDEHSQLGATWFSKLGYPQIADIIRQHHDLDSLELNETAIVNIADKLIDGDRRICLDARFEKSGKKCISEEAKAAHLRRYKQAFELRDVINSVAKKEVII